MSSNSSFSGNENNFLPEAFIFPADPETQAVKIWQYLNQIAAATNSKDSGLYNNLDTISGQQFLPIFNANGNTNLEYRDVIRKVIDFGALPNAGAKSVAHGINVANTNFSVTRVYAAATQPGNSWIPIPFASPTLNLNISLELTATNITITTGINRTAYTRCFVIVEYITIP
jgi:hypothetical protein